jgi:hypothetical protein
VDAPVCRACKAVITLPKTGRPPPYCSVGCRRMIQHKIRRINKTISRLEESAAYYRFDGRVILPADAAQAEFIAAELVKARARLRELLD